MKEWRGIPRAEIPWFPTIDAGKCTGCKACLDFCRDDALEFSETLAKVSVKNPYNCVVQCRNCSLICPTGAITFPEEKPFVAFIKEKLAARNV